MNKSRRHYLFLLIFFILIPLLALTISLAAAGARRVQRVYLPVIIAPLEKPPEPPFSGWEEKEPNNRWDQANGVLVDGRTCRGKFPSAADEQDYYFFYQGAEGPVTLRLTGIGTGHNYDLVLRDSNRKKVGHSGELENSDEKIELRLGPGLYYVQVYNWDKTSSNQSYNLFADYIPPATPIATHTPGPTRTPGPTNTPIPTITPTPTPSSTPLPTRDPGSGVWRAVGSASGAGISNNKGDSGWPDVAINSAGQVYVGWFDETNGNREIYVRKWTGSQWAEVGSRSASGGGISNNKGQSQEVALALKPDGNPCAAWRDWSYNGRAEVYVRCWNGSWWAEIGGSSASGGGVSNQGDSSIGGRWLSMAISANGIIYLTWDNFDGHDSEIYAAKYDGGGWNRMGTNGGNVSSDSTESWTPALALTPGGTPYIAWQNDHTPTTGDIFVKRWNGSSWVEVGYSSASGGGISNTLGHSGRAAIAMDSNGRPYVAWSDSSWGDSEIYVRRWSGSSWITTGSGSASGGGISNNSGNSRTPSIDISDGGLPCITWYDKTLGQNEVYVRCLSGSTWVEAGYGSASGGGISSNSGQSALPVLAFDRYETPYVAWGDSSGGDYEIYVRRFDSTN